MEAGKDAELSPLPDFHRTTSKQMTMTIFKGSRKVSSGAVVHESSKEHRPIRRFLRKMSFSRLLTIRQQPADGLAVVSKIQACQACGRRVPQQYLLSDLFQILCYVKEGDLSSSAS